MREIVGYGIFSALGVGAAVACVASIGWMSVIVIGVIGLVVLASWLVA